MSIRGLAVIEDSDEDFAALSRALAGGPETVVRYRDGDEALVAFVSPEAVWPAVVLLDLNLPGRPGLEVLKAIRAEPALQRLPVVVLSGSSRREDVLASYEQGANAYIVKPLDFAELRRALMSVWSFWNLAIVPSPAAPADPEYGLL